MMLFCRMLREQLYQLFRRKEFCISLAVMMIYCLGIFLFYCEQFQGYEINEVFPAYETFAGNYNFYGFWGNLKIIFPILAVLPFADSYLVDRKTGERTLTLIRTTPGRYYWSKAFAVFLSAFLVFFIPLLTNFLLSFLAFPTDSVSHLGYDSFQGAYYLNLGYILFAPLFWYHPYLYNLLFVFHISAVCGLIALFTYSLSFFIRNRLIILFLFFFLHLLNIYIEPFIDMLQSSQDFTFVAYIFAFADVREKNYVFYFVVLGVLIIGSVALICWKSARRRDVL